MLDTDRMIALLKGEAQTPQPSVVGIDPGITKVGMASSGKRDVAETISFSKTHARSDNLSEPYRALWWWEHFDAIVPCYDVVVIKGYNLRAKFRAHQMGEVGGLLRLAIARNEGRYAIVPPARLKMFATGKGNAPKSAVVDAARDLLGLKGRSPDQADALWLLQIGLYLAAHQHPRRVDLPEENLRALSVVSLHKGLTV